LLHDSLFLKIYVFMYNKIYMNIIYNRNEISKNGLYRLGVGAIIENNGLIFCATRISNKNKAFEDTLQMPQGGIEENEDTYTAALREIYEETGIASDKIEYINHMKNWIYYDIPKEFIEQSNCIGQALIWYHFKFLGQDKDINLNIDTNPEFSEFFWKKGREIVDNSIFFKQAIHDEVFKYFNFI